MTDFAPLLASLRALQSEITLDKRHCYRRAGKVIPGTTSIIKILDAPALDAWKVRVQVEGTARAAFHNPPDGYNVDEERRALDEIEYVERLVRIAKAEFEHERLANEAADVGKQVHALIEHAIREQLGEPTEPPAASEEALFTFAGWRDWAKGVGLEPLMAEGRVYHPSLNYCGTFDLLAMIDGRPAIADWKPQARIYPERRLQSAAYREALHYMGWPPLEGYIVAMPRDGGAIEMLPLEYPGQEMAADFDAFKACLDLYRWLKAVQKAERAEAAA